ncbi:MAG: DNA mismatch repair endonuclease MutL [Halorubrum sp.]
MEPPEIERLDERTIQRIAAGEVVERPASVVKELVENSLDAGASRVAVSVEAGGTEGIRVRDDGVGIPADQLEAAVAEHATSKIGDIEDLDAGVATLGFRGEALYTVAGVSRLTVRSKPPDADAGAEITVEGGSVGDVRPAGCPTGTVVEVDDLFYNTPARKKFLKQVTTEFDHVNTVVTSYALANPDVAVSLEHDGRETFATEGNGDLRSAVLAVYGREVAESMVDVDWTGDEATPVGRVTGLVSHPETTRAGREYLGTYVNGRYVTAGSLREAVLDAYGGQLAPDRYPFAVLFVELPPNDVDVNVHPRKLEVRFDEEAGVRAAVTDAVESALLDHGLIRSTAPRGRSAPDEVVVDPESPDTEAVGGAGAGGAPSAQPPSSRSPTDRSSEADATDTGGTAGADESVDDAGTTDANDTADTASPADANSTPDAEAPAGQHVTDTDSDSRGVSGESRRTATELDPDDENAWAVDGLGGGDAGGDGTDSAGTGGDDSSSVSPSVPDSSPAGTARTDSTGPEVSDTTGDAADRPSPRRRQSATADTGPAADRSVDDDHDAAHSETSQSTPTRSDGRPTGPTSQRTLDGNETTDERTYDALPRLRVLGQLHETYVIAEAPDGLVLIDQHAADERVNYERLQREFADGMPAQALAQPVTIELTAREAALFGEFTDELAEVGFRAKRAGDRDVVIEAVPAVFDATLDPELLRDALSSFVSDATGRSHSGGGSDDETAARNDDRRADGVEAGPVTDVVDDLLADLACYPSVTGNTSLTAGSVIDLLDRLDDCTNPYACPHGRPVIIQIDHDEIGSRFERDYPGHGERRRE